MKRTFYLLLLLPVLLMQGCQKEPAIDPGLRVRPIGITVTVNDNNSFAVSWQPMYIVCVASPCPDLADVEAEEYEVQIAPTETGEFRRYARLDARERSITIPAAQVGTQLIVRVVALNKKASPRPSKIVMASAGPVAKPSIFNGYGTADYTWGGTITSSRTVFSTFIEEAPGIYKWPVYVADLIDGTAKNARLISQEAGRCILSPDGTQLAFSERDKNTLNILNLETGSTRLIPVNDLTWLTSMEWSPDGQSIAYLVASNDEARIWKVNLLDGQLLPLTPILNFRESNSIWKSGISWTPDGRSVAASRGRANGDSSNFRWTITLFSADGKGEISYFEGRPGWLDHNPSFSPDGKRMAFFSSRTGGFDTNSLWIRELATNQIRQIRLPADDYQLSSDFQPKWLSENQLICMGFTRGIIPERSLRRYFMVTL